MATDLGTDIELVFGGNGSADLSPLFGLVDGRRALAQAIACRLLTPAGGLLDDPEYGAIDLRAALNDAFTAQRALALRSAIEDQAERDERVLGARAAVEFSHAARTLTVTLELEDAGGPFRLVLAVSAVTVALLAVE